MQKVPKLKLREQRPLGTVISSKDVTGPGDQSVSVRPGQARPLPPWLRLPAAWPARPGSPQGSARGGGPQEASFVPPGAPQLHLCAPAPAPPVHLSLQPAHAAPPRTRPQVGCQPRCPWVCAERGDHAGARREGRWRAPFHPGPRLSPGEEGHAPSPSRSGTA